MTVTIFYIYLCYTCHKDTDSFDAICTRAQILYIKDPYDLHGMKGLRQLKKDAQGAW